MNAGSDGTINNDKLNQAITDLKAESKAGHDLNINDMTQIDDYKSPWKDKYATTVNDTAFYHIISLVLDMVVIIPLVLVMP